MTYLNTKLSKSHLIHTQNWEWEENREENKTPAFLIPSEMTVLFFTPHIKVGFSPRSQSNPLAHYPLIWVIFIERDLFLCLFFIQLQKLASQDF